MKRQFLCLIAIFFLLVLGLGSSTTKASSTSLRSESFQTEADRPELAYDGLPQQPLSPADRTYSQSPVSLYFPWSKVVFQSYRDNNWEIYSADLGSETQTRLTNNTKLDINPRFNRDCSQIVFTSDRTGHYQIFVMNWDGSGVTQLTWDTKNNIYPAWSPDGSKIVFQSYRDGNAEIYTMNADSSNLTRLTWDAGYDGMPVWSPDGSKIAFISQRTGNYLVYVMAADGSNLVQLSQQAYSETPGWSPDGTQIAYDADGDGDGWQELWLMNADGSNQRQVFNPSEANTSAWARSWSPDGRYIAFTYIKFINYRGNWYWLAAYLEGYDIQANMSSNIIDNNTEWEPDWRSTDGYPPTSNVLPLPGISPATYQVTWTGSDAGPSGLKTFDVQVRDGAAGNWTIWQQDETNTSAINSGVGGHTYFYRSRGRDYAGNVELWPAQPDASTTIEALAPRTSIFPLPAFVRSSMGGVVVQWSGEDPGGSGIANYDVDYRRNDSINWVNWMNQSPETNNWFTGEVGYTYYFRVRGRDAAQNLETWPGGNGDAWTTFYQWGITGKLHDNRGAPLTNAQITTLPAAFQTIPGGADGNYAAYIAQQADPYHAAWAKNGYLSLPSTAFAGSRDALVDIYMPPADNAVQDGGFEAFTRAMGSWMLGGTILPSIATNHPHTGQAAVHLGSPPGGFGAPVNISNSDQYSQMPQVGIDSAGTLHVVWVDTTGNGSEVYTAFYKAGPGWSLPVMISTGGSWVSYPAILVEPGGAVNVIWEDTNNNLYTYQYARRETNGIWSAPQTLTVSNLSGGAGPFSMGLDASGNLHVVWMALNAGSTQIYYARRASNGSWSTAQQISTLAGNSANPRLAVGADGSVHAAWMYTATGDTGLAVSYAYRDPAGNWHQPEVLSPSSGNTSGLLIGVAPGGVVHVVWYDNGIWYRQRSGGAWSAPEAISSLTSSLAHQLIVDGAGTAHLIWHEWTGVSTAIRYSRRPAGGAWSTQDVYRAGDSPTDPSMTIDGHGAIHVTWWNQNAVMFYTQDGAGSGWFAPIQITPANPQSQPQLAAGPDGIAHVVWQDASTNGISEIYEADSTVLTQNGDSIVSQSIVFTPTNNAPTLSFMCDLNGVSAVGGAGLNVLVSDGISPTTLLTLTHNTSDWAHSWVDMSNWAGHVVTLTFRLHELAGYPPVTAYLDEVSLGSSYPDAWVKASGVSAALPGSLVVYRLTYANRGGTEAAGVVISATLPAGLQFVSASITPTQTGNTLAWDLGKLPAMGETGAILITATVTAQAPSGGTLTLLAEISTATPELELANNTFEWNTYVGKLVYLPYMGK